jgi:hypothetical protein
MEALTCVHSTREVKILKLEHRTFVSEWICPGDVARCVIEFGFVQHSGGWRPSSSVTNLSSQASFQTVLEFIVLLPLVFNYWEGAGIYKLCLFAPCNANAE